MCIESRAEKKNNQKDFNNNKNLFCIFWLGKLPKLAAQKHQNQNEDYSQTSGPTRQSCGSSCFGDPRTRNNEHLKKKKHHDSDDDDDDSNYSDDSGHDDEFSDK